MSIKTKLQVGGAVAALSMLMFAVTASAQAPSAVQPMTLDEALAIAAERAYPNRAANGELAAMEGTHQEALSGFLPHVKLGAGYVRSDDPVNVFSYKLKQRRFDASDFEINTLNNPDPVNNFSTSAMLRQPLLHLDAIHGRAATGKGVDARKHALARTADAVRLQVKTAYYGLVLARENFDAIEEAVRSAERHRDDARAAFDEGMINEADYLVADVRLAELEEQRISARYDIENASDVLKLAMGYEADVVIVPSDVIPSDVEISAPVDAGNVAQRADIEALRLGVEAKRSAASVEKGRWAPRLDAFGGLEWNSQDAFDGYEWNWTVGVLFEWDVFQGAGQMGRTRRTAAEVVEAEALYKQAEQGAHNEIRRWQRSLASTRERVAVAAHAVAQATESHRIAEERFGQGLEKTSELLDKEVALTNARMRLLRARYDFAVAASELEFAAGPSLSNQDEVVQ